MARAMTMRRRPAAADDNGRTAVVAEGARRGAWGVARLVMFVARVVVLVIVAGILLVVLKANPGNEIVQAVTDAARWLAGPFKNLFTFHNFRTGVAVNWGIAAVVYYLAASLVARLLAR
jgi:hypothetical protein